MAGTENIFRTSNPLDFTSVDGIYIDERRPPTQLQGAASNIVAVVGEFERGPVDTITAVGSTRQFRELFGGFGPRADGSGYPGYLALLNKRFDRLRVIRVSNASMATAMVNLADSGAVNVLRVDASSPGQWGNNLTVSVEPATDGVASHFDLRVKEKGVQVELHRNLDLSSVADGQELPIVSSYITATRIALGDGRPADAADVVVSGGSDGTFTDSDYTGSPTDPRGLKLLEDVGASDVRFVFVAERNTSAVKSALRDLAETTKTKIVFIGSDAGDDVATAVADVAGYRSDRVVYVYPQVKTRVPELNGGAGGVATVSATSFAAAALAALPPGTDPAGVNAEPFLGGIVGLDAKLLSNDDYRTFASQGIMGVQRSASRQRYGFRSGVNTSLDPALQQISRRTMADFLQESIAKGLVWFQNRPLNEDTKLQIKGAIEEFLSGLQSQGVIPSEADISTPAEGTLLPWLVDIESGNTPTQEAAGLFVVYVKVRIFASLRFLVLRTEIGEGVEIREE